MTAQVEIRMVRQVDWCWFCCCRLILHRDGIIASQFAFHRRQNIARIAFVCIGREMTQVHDIAVDMMAEVEFIEADDAAVQMMFVVPVFRDFIIAAVQGELAARNPIRDTTDKRSKVRIALAPVSSDIIESQYDIAHTTRPIRHLD